MPIPDLSSEGYLPPGIHPCTLDEVRDRFGTFNGSDRRCRLFEKLEEYVREAKSTGIIVSLLIDGSFVTGKPAPDDIDMVVVLPAGHDFRAELRPFDYNVLSRVHVRRRWGFDVFIADIGSPAYDDAVAFFQHERVPRENVTKGILEVRL